MIFKGHQKISFIDYPSKICTVFFSGGCNFRCPYCHNSSLVYNKGNKLSEKYIYDFLDEKRNYLDAVCISGGECTLFPEELYNFLKKIKEVGFLTKIDTNGTNPQIVEKLINDNLLDYIAMDIKAPFDKYHLVAGVDVDINLIENSIEIIKNANIQSEFRTTVCKELLTHDDIEKISTMIDGAQRYVIQNFKDNDMILAGKDKFTPYNNDDLTYICNKIKNKFKHCNIR